MKEKLLNALAPVVGEIVERVIHLLFNAAIQKNGEHAKTVVASLYPIVDVELEPLVKKTEGLWDDFVVKGVINGLELTAIDNDIQLANLDND